MMRKSWVGAFTTVALTGIFACGENSPSELSDAKGAAAASAKPGRDPQAPPRSNAESVPNEAEAPSAPWGRDSSEGGSGKKSKGEEGSMATASPSSIGLSGVPGQGGGYGNGSGLGGPTRGNRPLRKLDANAPPPPPQGIANTRAMPPAEAEPAPPPAIVESVMDPNGRFATTYRPGGGHLSAFESAIALGVVPAAEREIVSDIGARYLPAMSAPEKGALAFQTDLERGKLAPGGGPVHVRLSLRSTTAAATEKPPLSIVVVLDTSGSMRGKLIQHAREAASQFVDKLSPQDEFSLVTFATEAQVLVPMGKIGSRAESIKKTISEIKEEGGTNIWEGLRLGYAQATEKTQAKDAYKVVMLLSDGRATSGVTNGKRLAQLSLDAFQSGVQTSTFGMGTDYDGPLMSQIANDGAGGYYYLPDGSQIAAALATELGKRLDPVATAVEVRVRLKPGVELLNVYGSRRLNKSEAAVVRAIEVAEDKHTAKRDKIKTNREEDTEGGMRFFMPAFARDDSHSILLKIKVPEGVGDKDVALIELKYKDRLTKKNVIEELPVKASYANSDAESAASIDGNMRRTIQGFAAGEALSKAAQMIAEGNRQEAIELLGEREGLLHHAAAVMGEPLFVQDAKRLARLRTHASGKGKLADPLVLAMMMETAGGSHLH